MGRLGEGSHLIDSLKGAESRPYSRVHLHLSISFIRLYSPLRYSVYLTELQLAACAVRRLRVWIGRIFHLSANRLRICRIGHQSHLHDALRLVAKINTSPTAEILRLCNKINGNISRKSTPLTALLFKPNYITSLEKFPEAIGPLFLKAALHRAVQTWSRLCVEYKMAVCRHLLEWPANLTLPCGHFGGLRGRQLLHGETSNSVLLRAFR